MHEGKGRLVEEARRETGDCRIRPRVGLLELETEERVVYIVKGWQMTRNNKGKLPVICELTTVDIKMSSAGFRINNIHIANPCKTTSKLTSFSSTRRQISFSSYYRLHGTLITALNLYIKLIQSHRSTLPTYSP